MRWPRRFGERGWLVRPQDSNSARAFVPEFGGRRDYDAGDVICEFDLRAVLPTVLRAAPQVRFVDRRLSLGRWNAFVSARERYELG